MRPCTCLISQSPLALRIGYIAVDNDVMPETLRQMGIQVDMLDEVALAFGDLSRYDAIVVGIRAYELRPDVARSNPRLLDYVKNGGTLLVLIPARLRLEQIVARAVSGEDGGPGARA